MNSKEFGLALIALGLVVVLVNISFTMEFMARGLILHNTCTLDDSVCPFIEIPWQGISVAVIGIIIIVFGLYFVKRPFESNGNGSAPQKADMEYARKKLDGLEGDEKQVFGILIEENGMVFQSKLIEKTGHTKVKVSRLLDSLENKGLVERKRRGMTNVVVLK